MTGSGSLISPIAGGKHLDGVVQVTGGGHTASWMDAASPEFHAYSANAGIAACQNCHGVNLEGVGGSATTSCATCHGATWKTNCTLCHGGTANKTGAPPKGTWGFRTDALRIGAHTKHVVAGPVAPAFACAVCHVPPADALAAGHLDGSRATVTWSGISSASGANPAWNQAAGSCASTYCHGGYSGTYQYWLQNGTPMTFSYRGSNGAPTWSGGPMTCTSCHGNPPTGEVWHSGAHPGGNECNLCHPYVVPIGSYFTSTATHINGTVDVWAYIRPQCRACH